MARVVFGKIALVKLMRTARLSKKLFKKHLIMHIVKMEDIEAITGLDGTN
jgi:hypothetical protein